MTARKTVGRGLFFVALFFVVGFCVAFTFDLIPTHTNEVCSMKSSVDNEWLAVPVLGSLFYVGFYGWLWLDRRTK